MFRSSVIAVLCAGTLATTLCWAKDKPTPKPDAGAEDGKQPDTVETDKSADAANRETARNLMNHGYALYKEGKFEEALRSFIAADEMVGVTSSGLEVGRTLAQVGRLLEARDKLLTVARMPSEPGEPAALAEARREANTLQQEVAKRIPTLTFELNGLESTSQVTLKIGDYTVPSAAVRLPQRVDPGDRHITASCPGYRTVSVMVEVIEGEKHLVVLGFKRTTTDKLPKTTISPLVYAGFGTAGVGLLLGAITGGVSLKLAGEVEERCTGPKGNQTCDAADESKANTSLALAHVSTVSFILAGAGVAVGVVGCFMSGEEAPPEGAPAAAWFTVEPVVGLGSLSLRGTF